MSKFTKHSIFIFVMSLVLTLQIFATEWVEVEGDTAPIQNEGKRKFKHVSRPNVVKWSSEHLNPQDKRPSPSSTLWLAQKSWIIDGSNEHGSIQKEFSFWIVSPGKIHGTILGASYDESPLKILYFLDKTPISEETLASTLDLAVQYFSNSTLTFKKIHFDIGEEHPTLALILQNMQTEEAASASPSYASIREHYDRYFILNPNKLSSGYEFQGTVSRSLMRRPKASVTP